jgi:hypothetical protein
MKRKREQNQCRQKKPKRGERQGSEVCERQLCQDDCRSEDHGQDNGFKAGKTWHTVSSIALTHLVSPAFYPCPFG